MHFGCLSKSKRQTSFQTHVLTNWFEGTEERLTRPDGNPHRRSLSKTTPSAKKQLPERNSNLAIGTNPFDHVLYLLDLCTSEPHHRTASRSPLARYLMGSQEFLFLTQMLGPWVERSRITPTRWRILLSSVEHTGRSIGLSRCYSLNYISCWS